MTRSTLRPVPLLVVLLASAVLTAGNCSQDRVKSMEANNAGVEQFKRKLYPQAIRELQRSIAIGDELATIGLDQIKFSNRTDLTERDHVTWGDPDQYGCYWYMEG